MKQFKMNKLNQMVLGTIIGVTSMNSFAQTDAVTKDPALMPLVNSVKANNTETKVFAHGAVTQIGTVGTHPSNKKPLKGFAKDLPLITVMKQITPNGWIVKKSDTEGNKVDIQKLVSWEGGNTWVETLGAITKTYNLNALVNWDEKVITLSNTTVVVSKPKKSVFELETTDTTPSKVTDIAVGASEQPVVENTSVKAPVVATLPAVKTPVVVVAPVSAPVVQPVVTQKSWDLVSSKSLKENVIAWGQKAGYRVVWTGEDYSVVDSRILAGEFDSENGPIKQLSEDYGPESRAQNPLSFQFYQNKTLVVENMMYEQSGAPQYNQKN
jgi:hypothetical protein